MTDQPPRGTRAEQREFRRRGARPRPEPDKLTRPYWEAAPRCEPWVQRHTECGAYCHPPSEWCRTCDSSASDGDLPCTGRVCSDLVRLLTNLRGCAIMDVEIGMPVRLVFEDRCEVALPQCEPA